jgi:hypothetical protein
MGTGLAGLAAAIEGHGISCQGNSVTSTTHDEPSQSWCSFWCRPAPDLSGLDEAGLQRRLEALGYHTHLERADRAGASGRPVYRGLYACRQEPADWEEVASRERALAPTWKGVIVARRRPRRVADAEDPEALRVGPFVLYGDPAMLDEVGRALGVPR